MDPRIKDLAFGAALNSILRSASMGTNMGSELRRIGTLPPPGQPSTPSQPPSITVPGQMGAGSSITDIALGPGEMGESPDQGVPFGNPQTGITDQQGVPLTVADLMGKGIDIIAMLTNPIGFLAGTALTGKTTGQTVKGMMTPVTTATPVISMAEIASQFGQQHGISPAEAMAILGGGSHVEMSGTPGPSVDTSNNGGIGESGGSVGAGMGVM
jgi:hypothetical protein